MKSEALELLNLPYPHEGSLLLVSTAALVYQSLRNRPYSGRHYRDS